MSAIISIIAMQSCIEYSNHDEQPQEQDSGYSFEVISISQVPSCAMKVNIIRDRQTDILYLWSNDCITPLLNIYGAPMCYEEYRSFINSGNYNQIKENQANNLNEIVELHKLKEFNNIEGGKKVIGAADSETGN